MKVSELTQQIKCGLHETWSLNFRLIDEPFEVIKPEYFTTTKVCDSLSELSFKADFPLVIRAEEQTKTVVNNIKHWDARGDNTERNGNIDITLYKRINGVEETIGIVEIKNFLKLKDDQSLYQNAKDEIEKDLLRNVELITKSIFYKGSLDFCAFTFYVNDIKSIVKDDGLQFISKLEKEVSSHVKSVLDKRLPAGVQLKIDIQTIRSNLFETITEAYALDDDGCPRYVSEPTFHCVSGIIYMYNNNSVLLGK
ncbi:hypothetical protein FT670_18925 [Aeromonas jandaei]|nr:hypothetical protein FT670_18925 [Aeromonas jandaei]